ncbi:MAG TPA: nucleotidyltransferase domain-containing protein [Elusimicrobiales bacterium]|nr:nucleotidyltransferase domain-containing protein [Elusimicrobiales bacterium]HPO95553.1 nucleotidyltransferase domain-containing protein [Elusimicrobiales bacterium]
MTEKEALEKIKEIILDECNKAGVEVLKIILFGSRARGDAKKDSDFDVYVVVSNDLDFKEKQVLITRIKRILAYIRIPNDIIFSTEHRFESFKNYTGSVDYYVNRDGRYI